MLKELLDFCMSNGYSHIMWDGQDMWLGKRGDTAHSILVFNVGSNEGIILGKANEYFIGTPSFTMLAGIKHFDLRESTFWI